MELPGTPFEWRERFGLYLALIAGALLLFVAYSIRDVSNKAGGDLDTLAKERVAVDYARRLQDVNYAFQDYRAQTTINGAREASVSGTAADRAVAAVSAFNAGEGATFGITKPWNDALHAWKTYRAAPDQDQLAARFARKLSLTFDAVQENSRLVYDPSISAQNLSDLVVEETSSLYNTINSSAMIAVRFVQHRKLDLTSRIDLAIIVHSIGGAERGTIRNIRDETNILLAQELKDPLTDPVQTKSKLDAALNASEDWIRYGQFQQSRVLVSNIPTVSIADIERYRIPALASLRRVDASLTGLLAQNLETRIRYEQNRRRLYQLATLLALVFLIGIMMEIIRLVARRDREALRQVQEESTRLSAELAREHAERALALTEAQFRAVFDGAAVGIAILDHTGEVVDANPVFRDHFGRNAALFLEGHKDDLESVLSGRRDLFEFEQHYIPDDGAELWANSTISVVKAHDGKPQFAMCMFRDITDIKHSERRLAHDMTHDGLTGLPNRLLFETQLRDRFAQSGTLLDSFFAVLFVDLDHFKDFNESLGHAAGDLVLQQVATRLRASLDPNDLVARLGSDEFAVLIRSLGDILHVESVARRILNNVCKPIQIGDRAVFAACSIGIAIGSATYERAEDVMRDANTAMSQAKSTGGSRFAVFDSNMHARAERRLQLTTDLRLALQRNEFRLLYQPIVRVTDGGLVACEALLRWDHPTEGLILPGDFMALAEQTGLAVPIGRFVFETACTQLAKWRTNWTGSPQPPFSMSVNVSASEIFDADFENFVVATCKSHGIDPRELTLEITESVVLDSNTRANLIFERLQAKGFKICIDDFGTGYSSLRYLQQFRIDALKIDRSFVASPDGEIASEPIVRTLMTLAEAFDLRVVAEGVESQRQRDMLRQAGCRFAQGYFYSRAISATDLAVMYPGVLARTNAPASA